MHPVKSSFAFLPALQFLQMPPFAYCVVLQILLAGTQPLSPVPTALPRTHPSGQITQTARAAWPLLQFLQMPLSANCQSPQIPLAGTQPLCPVPTALPRTCPAGQVSHGAVLSSDTWPLLQFLQMPLSANCQSPQIANATFRKLPVATDTAGINAATLSGANGVATNLSRGAGVAWWRVIERHLAIRAILAGAPFKILPVVAGNK